MNQKQLENVISERAIDADFEYNFDLNPFNYLVQALHWLVVTPVSLCGRLFRLTAERLKRIQEEQGHRRTFKGPACHLK